MPQLKLFLFGSPRLEREGQEIPLRRRKALALLAYLALAQRPQSRETLLGLLWSEFDPTSARNNLRRELSIIKKQLGASILIVNRTQIAINPAADLWLDVAEFEKHAAAGDVTSLVKAVAIYSDDFMAGFALPDSLAFDEWQFFQAEGLRQSLAQALQELIRWHTQQEEYEPGIVYGRRWLALDSLHEPAHRQLMEIYALAGQRAAALRQYQECERLLEEELGAAPEAETTSLYEAIRTKQFVLREKEKGQKQEQSAPQHNLPAQLSPFIGREQELAEINKLLTAEPACRLLTLLGPGGIGKTRLALQAAAEAAKTYHHGVTFVSLASISSVQFLIPTIADALALPRSGQIDPKEQLLNYLRDKNMLLLLDNFEHLLAEQGADLIGEILATSQHVKLMITSRERLNLLEEWGIDLQGMRFPAADGDDVEPLEGYSAVQLFVQRARQAKPGFTLSVENGPHVVHICHLTAGVPLALELAATWIRMMSCRDIASEIKQNLDFLDTSLRDIPERHQSLKAVFDHSWQLLSPEEKVVLRKLSVFRGGFRRHAAERVAGASLSMLASLVDKSLLRRTRAGRYEIHELLRQYAAEKLEVQAGESEAAREAHANYYARFLQKRHDDLQGKKQEQALAQIAAELDNVRMAWQWACDQTNVVALGKAGDSLLDFCDYQSRFREGEAFFRLAVTSLDKEVQESVTTGIQDAESKIVLAQMLRGQGVLSVRIGWLEQAQELLRQSVSLLREFETNPQRQLAVSLHHFANLYFVKGNYTAALQYHQQGLTLHEEARDRFGMGKAQMQMGLNMTRQGAFKEAQGYLRQSARLLKQTGDSMERGYAILNLGIIAIAVGEYAMAKKYIQEVTQLWSNLSYQHGLQFSLREQAYLALVLGDYRQAQKQFQKAITISLEIGTTRNRAFLIDGLGMVARLQGNYELAEQRHQEGLAINREVGEGRGIALCLDNLGRLAYDKQAFAEAAGLHEESVAGFKKSGNQLGTASALCHWGTALGAKGREYDQDAREKLLEALNIAAKIGAAPVALDVLLGLATLTAARGAEETKREQTPATLVLVLHHPASAYETKENARHLLAELTADCSPATVATAQEKGMKLNLNDVIAEILVN